MAKRFYRKRSAKVHTLALEEIIRLFQQAEKTRDLQRCNRYVFLARKIAMKHKVKIPLLYKRRFCKHCYAYLRVGETCRIRIKEGRKITTCFVCKKFMRVPYKR